MSSIPRSADRRKLAAYPITACKGASKRVSRRLRFAAAIRFWLCVITFGTAGCLFGVSMAGRHPVALTMSVLWWGIYFGFFGWSISAWIGFLTERTPVPPPQGADGPVPPAGHSHDVNDMKLSPRGNPIPAAQGTPASAPRR
jgi:hypothetical protein